MAEQLEKEIQLAICDYLALKKYFFWRQNTAPSFDKTQGTYRAMPKYSKTGVPDIIVIHKGIFIGLEVKRPKGHQSDTQKEFEAGSTNAGAKYYVVTSIDDVIKMAHL